VNISSSELTKMADVVRSRLEEVNSMLDAGLPDKSVLAFPNGGREIVGHAVKRAFIDRYA
jgi:hypothetical protein